MAAILYFRNSLAHGETESIEVSEILSSNDLPHTASEVQFPSWMHFCILKNAREGLDQTRFLIESTHAQAGLDNYPLSTLGSGSYSFKLLSDIE